jgi:regulator of sigma E protease
MEGLSNNFITILTAIIGFGILVFFHELGHFLMAKAFKIKVEVFSLGWGPKLIGFQGKETYYQIAWVPIGGFCKFKGDEMTDNIENMSKDPESFYGAKPYKRLIVAFFGPFMNYLIAILFLIILALGTYKEIFIPNQIVLKDDIETSKIPSPAKKGGLLTGDIITKINNADITSYEDIKKFMYLSGNQNELIIQVKRNNELKTLKIAPEWNPEQLMSILGVYYYLEPVIKYDKENLLIKYLGLKDKDKIVGINDDYSNITNIKVHTFLASKFGNNEKAVLHIKRGEEVIDKEIVFNEINHEMGKNNFFLPFAYPERVVKGKNIIEASKEGFVKSNEIIQMSAIGLYSLIFKPKKNVQNQIGGPVRTGYYIGQSTIEGFKEGIYTGVRNFISIIAYISLALAFFNLLPIPAVDGGHIILNLYEIITRKPISIKVIYTINMIGFTLLIGLTFLVLFFDVSFLSNLGK